MDYDNPAFRLFTILGQGKLIDGRTKCLVAWAELLDVEPDSPELLAKMGKVMELPSQTVAALLSSNPYQEDTTNHWLKQVQVAFESQVLGSTWTTFIDRIDTHSITYLQLHSQLIQGARKRKALDSGDLDSAKLELDEVLQFLLNSESIDSEVRVALARNLRRLITAIDEYRLTGSTAIFDSIEILFGHSYFDLKYAEVIRESTTGKRIADIVSVLANSMTIALGLPPISESVKGFLSYVKAAT